MSTDPVTHYIIVRKDLPTGVICAQIAHAAGESFRYVLFQEEPTTVVVCMADNLRKLERIQRRLEKHAIPHASIRESDAPYTGQLMALGLRPDYRSKLRKHTRDLQLLRFDTDD